MPPQRTPLRASDSNRPRGKDLSPYVRGKIVGMAEQGASLSNPGSVSNISIGCKGVYYAGPQRPKGMSALYSGRPSTYTI